MVTRTAVVATCLRWVLFTLFVLTAAAKLLSGHERTYSLTREIYYAASGFEIVLALLIISRFYRAGCSLAVMFCASGIVYVWVNGEQPCGCFGSAARLSAAWQNLTLGCIGLTAVVAGRLTSGANQSSGTGTPLPRAKAN